MEILTTATTVYHLWTPEAGAWYLDAALERAEAVLARESDVPDTTYLGSVGVRPRTERIKL